MTPKGAGYCVICPSALVTFTISGLKKNTVAKAQDSSQHPPRLVKPHLFVRRRKAKTSPGSTPSGKTITWWHRTVEPFKNETRPPYLYTCRCNLGFTRTSDGKSCHDLTVSSNFKLLRSCQILPALAAVSSAITRLTPFLSYSTAARNRVEHLLGTFSQQNSYQKNPTWQWK